MTQSERIKALKAIKWFNYWYSLRKVWLSSLKVLAGFTKIGDPERPIVMTYSISEDYARVWFYFAQKALGQNNWDFLIIDSSGEIEPSKFEGCYIIRFLNLYHGKKVDILLRKILQSEIIFLCDDDKYILTEVSEYFQYFQDPKTPVVSLSPRSWWKFKIGTQEFLPMGSYALMFKRSFFLEHQLRFQPPRNSKSTLKVFPPGTKHQLAHDTADYANEKLLLAGYNIITLPDNDSILGFSGLSTRRILLLKYGKEFLKQALSQAKHYREGSGNRGAIRSLYGIVKLEQLYQKIFKTPPRLLSGFSEDELYRIVENNPNITRQQKEDVISCFKHVESTYRELLGHIS